MKKLLFASAAILLAFIGTQAQTTSGDGTQTDIKQTKEQRKEIRRENKITLKKLEGNDINYQSKQTFFKTYGNVANVQWTKEKYFDQAFFNNSGVMTTAYFDFDGQLVGTTNEKTFIDLPSSAQKKISKEYKDYSIEKVVFYDDNENVDTDMILYGGQFDDEDSYFVELKKDNKTVVLQVSTDGITSYFGDVANK